MVDVVEQRDGRGAAAVKEAIAAAIALLDESDYRDFLRDTHLNLSPPEQAAAAIANAKQALEYAQGALTP